MAQTTNSSRTDVQHSHPGESRQLLRQRSLTMTGVVFGLVVTVIFYLLAPIAAKPFEGGAEFVQRYFCGHPLEYITSAMFFVGMGILGAKLWLLPQERRSVGDVHELLANSANRQTELLELVKTGSLARWLRDPAQRVATAVAQRLSDVQHYLSARSDGGLEDHLKYLADLASDRLLQSYSLIRTVTWAVPIMGFLGTVVGITMAIANVTPEQLDSSLPEVTAGLAVAFDTTAQALGMSMILVFGTFLVERSEQAVLNDVEQLGIDELLPLHQPTPANANSTGGFPAMSEWTAQMLAEQTESWSRHLAQLQSGWAEALTMQTDTLADALNEETSATLSAHRNSISGARDLYAATLQQSTHHFVSQLQQSIATFSDRVDIWQSAMQATTLAAASQSEELHSLGRTLLQLTESEERLVQLQDQLDRNLQSLQVVATLEQTLNSLNAAVHVLTAKTMLKAAA